MGNNIRSVYEAFPIERFPLPSEEDVSNLEARLKISLPPHYRRFLLEYNGGCFSDPNPYMTPLHKECPVDGLDALWGIGATRTFAELGHDVDLFDDNEPLIVLPIGYTGMGNLLYMPVGEDGNGSVCLKLKYCWTSFELADTMEEFFGLLVADYHFPGSAEPCP